LLLMDYAAAESACRQAVERDPAHHPSIHNLATALFHQGKLTEAEAWKKKIIYAAPEDAEGWALLGVILLAEARADEGALAIRRSVELRPHSARHSQYLVALQYTGDVTPETLLDEHQRWYAT